MAPILASVIHDETLEGQGTHRRTDSMINGININITVYRETQQQTTIQRMISDNVNKIYQPNLS